MMGGSRYYGIPSARTPSIQTYGVNMIFTACSRRPTAGMAPMCCKMMEGNLFGSWIDAGFAGGKLPGSIRRSGPVDLQ